MLVVGKMMKIWEQNDSKNCLHCSQKEDADHVLLFPEPSAIKKFQNLVLHQEQWRNLADTEPQISMTICELLMN